VAVVLQCFFEHEALKKIEQENENILYEDLKQELDFCYEHF